ncbi:glycosyltransferase family 4 protein [Patescibacteria group bacterium]|nr:glycosyltransferase family 4 protein [Patescibacteria group bacterium]MCL5091923.1 glycosyltransferase family 4 protein [Patescibacteria group bacterium]
MKILFFSSYYYPYTSGITTYPDRLLSHLARHHDITVLTFPHQRHLPATERRRGVTIVRMPYWLKISKGYVSPQALAYFFRFSRSSDLVILNIPNGEGLFLACCARLFGKKTVALFHCLVSPGQSWIFRIATAFLNAMTFFQLWLSQLIVGYTADYVNHSWVGRRFPTKIRTVFPPVSTAAPRSRAGKRHPDRITIGYAGRIAREKGIEYLIEAIRLVKQVTTRPVTLELAGPYAGAVSGEMDYYRKIVNLLAKQRLDYRFLGNLSDKKLGAFYRSIDLLVLPSVNGTEAFGMVQVEAMLQGTPVVATDLAGVRVPISLTKMGIVVPPQNPEALAEAITTVIDKRKRYTNQRLITKARSIFNSDKTYRFYHRLLKTFSVN